MSSTFFKRLQNMTADKFTGLEIWEAQDTLIRNDWKNFAKAESYYRKVGPWIMELESEGETQTFDADTPYLLVQKIRILLPHGWKEISLMKRISG